jgi:hypothetical protein
MDLWSIGYLQKNMYQFHTELEVLEDGNGKVQIKNNLTDETRDK